MSDIDFTLRPIGVIRSSLLLRKGAPRQGTEGAPDAWLEIDAAFAPALEGIGAGDELLVITWPHEGRRDTFKVYPRGRRDLPPAGVFATRSPDRPNPLGLHPVIVLELAGPRLKVGPIEAIDGTPVVDIKPVLRPSAGA